MHGIIPSVYMSFRGFLHFEAQEKHYIFLISEHAFKMRYRRLH